jgi:hypothetical protein
VSGIELPRQKYPFIGTLTFNRDIPSIAKPSITCTVSLVAPSWVISAAHCMGKKADLNVRKCIEGAVCERTEHNDFVYKPGKVKSYIRLGVGNFYKELADTKVYDIEYIIRPRKAYPSGGYGVRYINYKNVV